MSYVLTGQYQIVKKLQYVEETTFGVPPSSAAFVTAGAIQDFSESTETKSIKYSYMGSRDIYSLIKTGEMYSFQVKFNPQNVNLLNYGVNLPSGTGTIEKSLTMVLSQKLNNVENFKIFKGCRCDKVDVEVSGDSPINVTMSFLCKEITTPATTSGLTTPTFASDPTGTPWTNLDGGAQPLTFNSLALDTSSFKFSVANNLQVVKPNGELQAKFIDPTRREITFDFETYEKDTALIADVKSLTARAMVYRLTGSVNATFTDAYLEQTSTSDSATANEVKMRSYSGTAKSLLVA